VVSARTRRQSDVPLDPAADGPRPERLRERLWDFIFREQAEHERFGVFDPFLRWTFVVGIFIAAVLAAGSVLEAMGSGPLALAAAGGAGVVVVAGGWVLRGRIWRKPSEREILLQLAREDDEARALRERLEREEMDARKRA